MFVISVRNCGVWISCVLVVVVALLVRCVRYFVRSCGVRYFCVL